MTNSDISVVMPSSVIPTHPSTAIIEETIISVRNHLPDSPIYVMCDGLRDEQKDRRGAYGTYIRALEQLELPNVKVIDYQTYHQQVHMTRRTIWDYVRTQFLLFVEHDTPLCENRFVDWSMLKDVVSSGITNMVRLHYDEEIHRDHQHMMHGKLTRHLIRTTQWHQRPHLVRTDWYLGILTDWFTPKARTFIEDRMYGVCAESKWDEFKLTIYDPEGTEQHMKRSRDIDGRGDDPKFDTDLVY